eukprot:gene8434-5912_t
MSVLETFLRGGRPCQCVEDWRKFSGCYARWRWLAYFPRQWAHDIRGNQLSAPAAHFLMGEAAGGEWHLLLVQASLDGVKMLETELLEMVQQFLQETPVGLLPSQLDVVAVVEGDTHTALHLFDPRRWRACWERLRLRDAAPSTLEQHVSIGCVVNGSVLLLEGLSAACDPAEITESAKGCFSWAQSNCRFEALHDASYPDPVPAAPLLDALLDLNPLLYRGMFTTAGAKSRFARLLENKEAAHQTLKRQVGECTTFSVHVGGPDAPAYHVLLWQKPILGKVPVDLENIDPGPLTPQPLSCQLHIYRDRGEPLYLQDYIRDVSSTLDFCFDDYLHEDGEVFVQLAPVEGVPFRTLDAFLPFVRRYPERFPEDPFLEGSCVGFVFPRVLRRTPTGKTTKLNPMTKTRAGVAQAPPTEEDVAVAVAALRTLSQHVRPCTDADAAAGPSMSSSPPPRRYCVSELDQVQPVDGHRRCAWCERKREKLLRCGGCKVVFYCGRRHQALDWKEGAHRAECSWWKRAWEDGTRVVVPALSSRLEREGMVALRSLGVSYAVTLLHFVDILRSAEGVSRGVLQPLYVHVLWHDLPVMSEFFDTDARAVRVVIFAKSFSESQRNEVWAIEEEKVALVEPTGVLGDAWRQRGGAARRDSVFLFRLCNSMYHLFPFDNSEVGGTPDGVLSFGPLSGLGQNYLTAAIEAIADRFAGVVPCRFVESSLVGCLRTEKALLGRVANSTKCDVKVKAAMEALTVQQTSDPFPVELNSPGLSLSTAHEETQTRCVPDLSNAAEVELPIYTNSYAFNQQLVNARIRLKAPVIPHPYYLLIHFFFFSFLSAAVSHGQAPFRLREFRSEYHELFPMWMQMPVLLWLCEICVTPIVSPPLSLYLFCEEERVRLCFLLSGTHSCVLLDLWKWELKIRYYTTSLFLLVSSPRSPMGRGRPPAVSFLGGSRSAESAGTSLRSDDNRHGRNHSVNEAEEEYTGDMLTKPLYHHTWEFEKSDNVSKAHAYGICHLPLTATIIINIGLTFSIVAIICILPIQTMSTRAMDKLSTSLSSSLANTMSQAVTENMLLLRVSVQDFATAWILNLGTQQWEWTKENMPQMMQQICHLVTVESRSYNILYFSVTSPGGGYGAYCSTQYVGHALVGNYITDNTATPRYVIDPTTYTYAEPLTPYTAVLPMTPREYTAFGAEENGELNPNPWNDVIVPIILDKTNSGMDSGWLLFRYQGRAAITFSLAFFDSQQNAVAVTAAIQPLSISRMLSDKLLSTSIGEAVLFDPVTGIVFDYSMKTPPITRMDNWNWSAPDIEAAVPPLLRVQDITNKLMREAIKVVTGSDNSGYVVRWSVQFKYEGSSAIALATRIYMDDPARLNLTLVYVNSESTYASGMRWVRIVVFACVILILLAIGLADVVLVYLFLQPLHGLRDPVTDGETHDQSFSNISELATMQRHFMNLNLQLIRMKSFLPHSVLGPPPPQEVGSHDAERSGDYEGMAGNRFNHGSEAIDLHLNERALTDQVNRYRRKYCTLAVFFIHIFESESSTSLLENLSSAFLEAVIPTVVQYGGVIEIQRPDAVITTFGAQRYMTMHQQRAVQCALQVQHAVQANSFISPRYVSMVDVGDFFVGTCGAADRYARVTYKISMPTRPDVIKLCKSLDCQTLITQRLAVTLDDNLLLVPVDTVKITQDPKPVTFYELRGDARKIGHKDVVEHVRKIITTSRNAFEKMSSADYSGALQLLEPCEKQDRQIARLAELCRMRLHKGDTRPYYRILEHIRVDLPPYDSVKMRRDSSLMHPPPINTTNQMPDFDVSFFAFPSPSRIVEGVNPFDEASMDGDNFGALFDVVVDVEADEEVPTPPSNSHNPSSVQMSNTFNNNAFECVVAGEVPTKFVDLGGMEWTRSSDTLGSGAYADVYRGLSSTGTLAALKCIQLRSKNVALSSISEEIRVFSCLDHENIVQYLSVFVSDSYLIQIMEFVPGGALDCLTKSFGPLKPGAACRFVRDILCGLQYLHSKGIVHCDIKPHNVLLAMDGQCKLSDFGSAMVRAAGADGEIEDVLELRGTPGYMAPEVANGALPTPKSDIFSLGVTILELLLGKLPWEYVTPEETVESPEKKPPPTSQEKDTDPSPLLSDLNELNKGTETDYSRSPTSPRLPMDRLLRNTNEFVRQICLGNVAPRIPDTLNEDVVSFIEQCICHEPEKRATPDELLRHRWVM